MESSEKAYRLEVDKKFLDDLKNVDRETRQKAKKLIDVLEENPLFIFNFDIKKLKGYKDVYRLRIGKYRILFHVDKDNKIVVLLRFLKREKVYRKT